MFLTTFTRVRLPTGSVPSFRVSMRADLLAQLVDEDRGGTGLADGAGQLAQGLGHQPGLEADVAVAHLALDLRLRHEGRHRVDDDHVDRTGADQHVGDLESLLTGVRLRDEERVGVHAELLGVLRVEGVLGVDEGGDAARLLRVRHRVQGDRGLTGRLRTEDLHDPPAGQAADAERDVQRDRPGRDHLDRGTRLVAETHDGALAELALDLGERRFQGLLAVVGCHGCPL
ncbi:hypothetical protein GCM10010106_11520 [Thermopolyspora flexuosa]|nr:hypothetical protein GCM10010106_11520 [Thermopolyspora flexuosa]